MESEDLIVGIHSIAEALKNPSRSDFKLYATSVGVDEFIKRSDFTKESFKKIDSKILKAHDLQEVAKGLYKELGFEFQRIPSQIFLTCKKLPLEGPAWLYQTIEAKKDIKILCLDQVTDIHNLAAIVRSGAFFGIDAIVISRKKGVSFPPTYFRIASGATEYLRVVNCASLSKMITKMKEKGITCVGFSEHASETTITSEKSNGLALVLGAEDLGLSNAVARLIDVQIALKPKGQIKSLNVSVAAAVAMEKFF